MADSGNKNKPLDLSPSVEPTHSSQLYTVAAEKTGVEIPGITKLLDRNSLEKLRQKTAAKERAKAPDEAVAPAATNLPELSQATSHQPEETSNRLAFEKRDVSLVDTPMSFELDMTGPGVMRPEADQSSEAQKPSLPPSNDSEIAQALANISVSNGPALSDEPMSFQVVDEGLSSPESVEFRAALPRSTSSQGNLPEYWSRETLLQKGSADPLTKVISILIGGGAHKIAVFMPEEKGIWRTKFLFNAGTRADAWTDCSWAQNLLPDLWKTLSKTSAVEIGPLGKSVSLASSRSIIRSALDVRSKEWLSLIELPKFSGGHALLVAISSESIQAAASAVVAATSASSAPLRAA